MSDDPTKHRFEISVTLYSEDRFATQTVYAWDLASALAEAARIPLYKWFPEDE